MNPTLQRIAADATQTIREEQHAQGAAHRLRYGTPADIAAGVADVLERRKTYRVPLPAMIEGPGSNGKSFNELEPTP